MAGDILVFVGTYTRSGSEGVYLYEMDAGTGALRLVTAAPRVESPSYLAIAADGRHVYTVSEVEEFAGRRSGAVSAFAFDPARRAFTLINQQPSEGNGPCHIAVEPTGRYALVANYGGGSVAMLPIGSGGGLDPATAFVQHAEADADPQQPTKARAHSMFIDPSGALVFCADLGLDRIFCYRMDLEQGRLLPHDPPHTDLAPGSGPRHLAFHPSGRYLYAITELGNTVVTFAYDAAAGRLRQVQTVSTLPPGYTGKSYCADVHVSADGRFLYGSNRGHESIAVFGIDGATGQLALLGLTPCGGEHPRSFGIDPTGRFLLVANGHSDNIVVFRRDAVSGALTPAGQEVRLAAPVCVKMRRA